MACNHLNIHLQTKQTDAGEKDYVKMFLFYTKIAIVNM